MTKSGKHARHNLGFYKHVGGFNQGHRSRAETFREKERAREYRQMEQESQRQWGEKSKEDC